MAIFDTVTKEQARTHPMDFVNLCLEFGQNDATFVEIITPEQPTVEIHQADIIVKVQLNSKEVLTHFEFQTTDSYDPEMSLRMAGYIIRLIETYRLPVYSSVIYLRPEAGSRDAGFYEQDVAGHRVFIEYKVVRLIEMDGQIILDAKPAGLLPFTPLMKRPENMDADDWLRRCVQTADSVDIPNKPKYLGILAVLGNLVYEAETISNIILEETMHHPSIIEYWTEKAAAEAHQQGMRESTREKILEALELRLQPGTAHTFKPILERIDDLQHLKSYFVLRYKQIALRPSDRCWKATEIKYVWASLPSVT